MQGKRVVITPDGERHFQVNCENCGIECNDHRYMNFIPTIPSIARKEFHGKYLQCPKEEHFSCENIECLRILAHRCIDECLVPSILALHEEIEANGNQPNQI